MLGYRNKLSARKRCKKFANVIPISCIFVLGTDFIVCINELV